MIIDVHTHIFPVEIRNNREAFFDGEPAFRLLYDVDGARLSSAEELIENMDTQGIDKSVVFGFPWERSELFMRHNDYILDAVQRYTDRLIGFATACPLSPDAGREMERCLDAGLSGIGELAFYTGPMGPGARRALAPLAELAERHDVPLLIHTNEPVGHTYPGKAPLTLAEIYAMLQAFPRNRIILAHWGGGIFFYHLMRRNVKDVLKNTWFDTAASPFLYDPRVYALACKTVGPDKILLGSDFPLIKPARYVRQIEASGLPGDDIRKMCGDNAASLLHLTQGPISPAAAV